MTNVIDIKRNSQLRTVDWSNWSTSEWNHSVKSVQIPSFFWSVFSRIRTEYGEIRSISPCSVRMRENTEQKKHRIWTLFTQWAFWKKRIQKKKESVYNRVLCICEIAGTLMIKNSKYIICIKCITSKLKTSETYVKLCCAPWTEAALQRRSYKGILKIYSKFAGEHPCRSAISISNFIEITLWHGCPPVNFQYIFRTSSLRNTSRGLASECSMKISQNPQTLIT